MPRFLSRLPYGAASKPVEEFNYEEFEVEPKDGRSVSTDNGDYCWSNAAYAMATNMTAAFSQYGFCTAIRGAEGGGKVEGLPTQD
ncbi:type VI secretion system contractile sheath large subunit, partial [Psychrobacter sp. SIMBA_152]